MDFYVFQADVYCVACGADICAKLPAPDGYPDEHIYDSGDYPKGPYGPEEADSPQHCAGCGLFLQNPLTRDGYAYVREALASGATANVWRDFYGV